MHSVPKPILKPILKRGRRRAGAPLESVKSACAAIYDACGAHNEAKRVLLVATRKYDMLKRLNDVRFAKLEAAGVPEGSKACDKVLAKTDMWEQELQDAWERLEAWEGRLATVDGVRPSPRPMHTWRALVSVSPPCEGSTWPPLKMNRVYSHISGARVSHRQHSLWCFELAQTCYYNVVSTVCRYAEVLKSPYSTLCVLCVCAW